MSSDLVRVPGCDFCSIVAGKKSATQIWSDENCLAFFPLEPATVGHSLVIPRSHVVDLWQADAELVRQLMAVVMELGRAIVKALDADGINLITSAGRAAEQTVFHLHLHLVPRWHDDAFGNIWPTSGTQQMDDLPSAAESIRAAITADRM